VCGLFSVYNVHQSEAAERTFVSVSSAFRLEGKQFTVGADAELTQWSIRRQRLHIGEVEDSRLTMRKLNGYSHRLVASPSYLDERGVPTRPSDLSKHSCLRYRLPTSGLTPTKPDTNSPLN
jgi:hypothetical protein